MAKIKNEALIEQLALAYVAGSTIKAWSEERGIPPRTCYSWTRQPEFKRIVREHRERTIDACLTRLINGTETAANEIVRLSQSAEAEPVRLSACRAVMDAAIQMTSFATLAKRVDELETELATLRGANLAIHPQIA